MAFEIERKFLVVGEGWRSLAAKRTRLRQAYLAAEGAVSIRVRIKDEASAVLTIKSEGAGPRRLELEYPVPVTDAEALIARRNGAIVEKIRHDVPYKGMTWEVDVFTGENDGLVLAELELQQEHQPFDVPSWIGAEVTHLRRFYNGDLALRPFCNWPVAAIHNVA